MKVKYFFAAFILISAILLISSAALSIGEVKKSAAVEGSGSPAPTLFSPAEITLDDFSVKDQNKLGGRTAVYVKKPSEIKLDWVKEKDRNVLKIDFDKREEGWCGGYTILKDADGNYFDASDYKAIIFKVKGQNGGEKFEIGLADRKWEEKEDSVKSGEVSDYLNTGITKDWQEVIIPLQDFERVRTNQLSSLSVNFLGAGKSTVYLADLAFSHKIVTLPKAIKIDKDVFVLENFETEGQNILGSNTAFYEKDPSKIKLEWTTQGAYQGTALKVSYQKDEFGWCGVYTQLTKKSRYFDISPFRTLSFMVKGAKGGELFEIKMADERWSKKQDAIKGGAVGEFLKGGVSTSWQEVNIPLDYFGDLDFEGIASLVFNFNQEGEGTVYFDNITLKKKKI